MYISAISPASDVHGQSCSVVGGHCGAFVILDYFLYRLIAPNQMRPDMQRGNLQKSRSFKSTLWKAVL